MVTNREPTIEEYVMNALDFAFHNYTYDEEFTVRDVEFVIFDTRERVRAGRPLRG